MQQSRRRILLVNGGLDPPGGGNAVAAWALQALRGEHRLTLLTWRRPDLSAVNRYYGTDLEASDFTLRWVPPAARRAVDAVPVPGALLRRGVLTRTARELLASGAYDLGLSTDNEMDLGRPGIQYVHYPYGERPRPECDLRWYHRLPWGLPAYYALCARLAGDTADGIRRNLTLVNSRWTGERMRRCYGVEAEVLWPPVEGAPRPHPWEARDPGFLCVGRIAPEKELEKVVTILHRVRRRGHPVRLHLVGSMDHPGYGRRILRLAERHREWIEVHLDLPKAELLELAGRNRYGIHGMVGEHFGIGVAELVASGCLVFAPDDGGPAEVVGDASALVYRDPGDAVDRIDRVLGSRTLQGELRRKLAPTAARLGPEAFASGLRRAVDRCLSERRGRPAA